MKRRDFIFSATTLGTAAVAPNLLGKSTKNQAIKPTGEPWPVRNTESFEFQSKSVGDKFAVGIWHPDDRILKMSGREAKAMDLVYVLDGSFALGLVSAICLLQLVDLIKPGFPPLLVVGIDYAVGDDNARSRDYTMADSVPKSMLESLNTSPKTAPGGADKFLSFLGDELDPWVRSNYDVSDKPAGILGDSFGGTFTYYAFIKQSKLFDKYWLGSPGIFTTDTDYVARFEERLKSELAHDTRMYLSFGALEVNGGVQIYEDMGRNFNRTVSALNRHPNDRLTWKARIYPGHTHTTILLPAINDAMLYLYGPHFP